MALIKHPRVAEAIAEAQLHLQKPTTPARLFRGKNGKRTKPVRAPARQAIPVRTGTGGPAGADENLISSLVLAGPNQDELNIKIQVFDKIG